MAELEPGHPDELVQSLSNWLREANSRMGALPEGVDPVEWAVRRFIDIWKADAPNAIDGVEENLSRAIALCDSQSPLDEIKSSIELARETLQEDLRGHLGLYGWNNE
jgi:hypothetical protein